MALPKEPTKRLSVRGKDETKLMETDYVVIGFSNFFPDKSIFSYAELKELAEKGIQITGKFN